MRSSRWTHLIALAAVAALGALALSIDGAGSGDAEPAEEVAPAAPSGGGQAPEAAEAGARARPGDRRAPAAERGRHRPALESPQGTTPVIWVRPRRSVAIRAEPGGEIVEVVGRETEFGSPTVLSVVEVRGRWAGVSTPAVPNDRLGWVRLDARSLRSGWSEQTLVVDLSERRAVLRERGDELRSFTVTIGGPGSETPTGRYAVTDTFRGGLNPVYGCCAVALSAVQPNVPSGWLGGNRIAIHGNGTGGPLGVAASNGCLRAADADVDALVDTIGLGAPVFIRE